MNREQRMHKILSEALSPSLLQISNESAKHAGHAGAGVEGDANYMQTHYNVEIHSDAFKGLSRVKAQQLVYGLLDEEFKSGLHALSLKLV